MLVIDGSRGEGGGQVLRTSLALSMITGTPVRIENVRARREKPGLKRQHLTAVRAAAEACGAEVDGAELGSRAVTFVPHGVRPGDYTFDIGTAGSTTLVLQTVLPALLTASEPSTLRVVGGTYAKHSPPWEFVERAYLPLLRRMGARVAARMARPGFYPAGGGVLEVGVEPVARLRGIELLERGAVVRRGARALVSRIPASVAERELRVVAHELGFPPSELAAEVVEDADGPGNVLLVEIECEHVTELFTGFGQRGVPAEEVARAACVEARSYLEADVPVGPHLADQLLLPLALAGEGRFRTSPLTLHALTNADVIQRFLDVAVRMRDRPDATSEVEVTRA